MGGSASLATAHSTVIGATVETGDNVPDAEHELARMDRFEEILDRAEFEGFDLVRLVAMDTQEYDRRG